MKDILVIGFPGTDYQQIDYSGGELQVRLTPVTLEKVVSAEKIVINAMVRNAAELVALLLLNDALRAKSDAPRYLYIPYLPYARADRRFTDGDCHGLAFFLGMLRTGDFEEIRTLDVHNYKAVCRFSGEVTNIKPDKLIAAAALEFAVEHNDSTVNILFPDAGAAKRYKGSLPSYPNCRVLFAEKDRDPVTGKLLGFKVPDYSKFSGGAVLIVDDICDAGGTFLGIADAMRQDDRWKGYNGCAKLHLGLYVTHGIFSKGFGGLGEYFGRIYTTNSFHSVTPGPKNLMRIFDAFEAIDAGEPQQFVIDSHAV